ncbi:SDR family oxidoreductase [Ideonella sp. YS5]|uniref:SDR family oxidoreductase n=1 Tax=Ideonella sp. YS5 TaxID=3453714 RepID=UPI003EEFAFDB
MSPPSSALSALSSSPDTDPHALRGQTVLITGGSRGLGGAIADLLGSAGAQLIIGDVAYDRAQDKAATLSANGIQAIALPLDVGNEDQVLHVMAQVRLRYGHLDVLVNNAAVDVAAPMAELATEDWHRIVQTNLTGPFLMAKHALALLAASPSGGQIVNIASTASKRTWPNAAAYHATKWGLLGLSHALHAELRTQGIKVSAVVAGGMRTPFHIDRFPDLDPGVLQDPVSVARAVRFVLTQPKDSVVPEMMVLPMRETSWP